MRLFIYELISAGSLGPDVPQSLRNEGAAMLAAAVEDFEQIPGVHALTLLAEDFAGSIGRHLRRTTLADEPRAFHDIAVSADAALIIAPEFDDWLDRRIGWAVAAGCRILGCNHEAIRLTGDKFKLARRLQDAGIATPSTQLLSPTSPAPTEFPCVLKPRHGAGSQATFLIPKAAAWPAALAHARAEWPKGDLILQPFHPGQPASVALLVGPQQILATPGATQRLSTDGRFRYEGGVTPLPQPLRQRAIALARRAVATVAGLEGWIGVDVILGAAADGREDAVIEINPRLTTSYIGLRRLARTNLADVWLRLWRGAQVDELDWSEEPMEFG